MKTYDLKGIIIEEKKAVIAIALPKPVNGNAYYIFDIHHVSENKILIHFKDFTGKDFRKEAANSDNFESFIIDLKDPKFVQLNDSNEIGVALCHENNDVLKDTSENIYNYAHRDSLNLGDIRIELPNSTGKGTIRP